MDAVRPLLLARRYIEREDVILLRQCIQGVADDERVEGVDGLVPGGRDPHRLQLRHIAAVYLLQ